MKKKLQSRQIEGPLLIIAGPGAGKTKTLVERIVYLIFGEAGPSELLQLLQKRRKRTYYKDFK